MVKLPLSTEASNKLIAFLYGFELEADTSLEVIKDLIFYGGVCGVESLRDAAGEILKTHLNKKNVFEVLKYCKENEAKVAVKRCSETIIKTFPKKSLLENGHIEEHPEIGIEILRKESEPPKKTKALPTNVLFCFDKMPNLVR